MPQMPYKKVGLQGPNPSPYWSPEESRTKSYADMMDANDSALQMDYSEAPLKQYDWASQASRFANQAAALNSQSAFNQGLNSINEAVQNSPGGQTNSTGQYGGYSLMAILRALGAQESGNSYSAVNSSSGAMGRWQVMPSNIAGDRGWDYEALGRNISTSEFLQNKALQDAIVKYKFNNYLKSYGIKGALSAWYSGDPNKWNNTDSQGNYPSIRNYVLQVLERLRNGRG